MNGSEQSVVFMSSTGQATSSTSNFQLIVDALVDYAKITGVDLFAATLEQSNSPEAILELPQEREKAFKECREGNRRLISCLSLAVKVILGDPWRGGKLGERHIPPCGSFNVTSSDSLLTSKGCVHEHW